MDRPPLKISAHSIGEAIRVANKDPQALYDYVKLGLKESVSNQLNRITEKIGLDNWGIFHYWHQIKWDLDFRYHIDACIQGTNYGQVVAPEMLYVLVRKLCPSVFVETGVSAGVSSAYILKAMDDNRYGKLYSIDYPDYALSEAETVPNAGFCIPDYLRSRWTLIIGKSVDKLVPLLDDLGQIDIFMHDSEHSHNNMLWEYETAWMRLKKGGLILSHDINDNDAFNLFAKQVKHKYSEVFFTGMGIIRK